MKTPRVFTPAEMKEQVKLLQTGWRWCSCCGKVTIDPELPSYAFKCRKCFGLWRDTQGQGESMIVQAEGYTPSLAKPHTKMFRLSSGGLTRYCGRCGDEIDEKKLRFAIFISAGKREASKCAPCQKEYKEPLNHTASKSHWIFVPDYWIQFREELLEVFQMKLI